MNMMTNHIQAALTGQSRPNITTLTKLVAEQKAITERAEKLLADARKTATDPLEWEVAVSDAQRLIPHLEMDLERNKKALVILEQKLAAKKAALPALQKDYQSALVERSNLAGRFNETIQPRLIDIYNFVADAQRNRQRLVAVAAKGEFEVDTTQGNFPVAFIEAAIEFFAAIGISAPVAAVPTDGDLPLTFEVTNKGNGPHRLYDAQDRAIIIMVGETKVVTLSEGGAKAARSHPDLVIKEVSGPKLIPEEDA
ncbi:hypothetical protein [Phyllobacterium endophyticum]|uniref:Uncharacterized protein n=1 Tax=Phyllobacterium endophyticum TaxID=1149773 RepID=A0A2P7AV04_9HYPH|nr:hypothetical protein [Phyllobacterium endophyticum]MBB3234532.1 hypothetical protein [Phyllobacterium endophyticum]PSH58017.1 hypothetical protein CU100_10140 [Phyllobacterium endophyticum]TYR38685.1 hypothetical protein FY050_22100 [Phyllobacterium endophyticum]